MTMRESEQPDKPPLEHQANRPEAKPKNPKRELWMRRLKRVAKVSGIVFGILILLLGIATWLAAQYEDEIGRALVKELNKNLKKEIQIGSIDLDLVRSFPNASVDLRDVTVPGAFGGTLLKTKLMAFKFNVMSLLGSSYKIKSVVVSEGLLNIKKNKRGKNNYEIIKSKSKSSGSTSETEEPLKFSIQLNRTQLQQIALSYTDQVNNNDAQLFLEDFMLSGNFSNTKTKLKSNAVVQSTYIALANDKYIPNANVVWDFDIDANFKEGIYEIKNSEVAIQSNTFKASGIVKQEDGINDIDVQLKGEDCTILSVITLLPDRFKESINDFNSRGAFYFNINLDGKYGGKHFPAVNAAFGLKNGQITSPRLGESLKEVSFAATFASRENQDSAVFDMSGFEAKLDEKLINIDLKLENIADPRVDFRFNGDVDLALVHRLSNNPYIKDGAGLIKVQDLLVKGRYKDMITSSRLSRVDASGIIDFEDFQIKYADEDFKLQDGYLTFTNELITARSIKLLGLNSDFGLNLNLYNVLPVLLSDDHAAKIFVDGELNSNNIDFDKILAMGLKMSESSPTLTQTNDNVEAAPTNDTLTVKGEPIDYTSVIRGRFKTNVKQFNFREVNGKNFIGQVEYNNRELIFNNVSVDAVDGRLQMTSNIRLKGAPRVEAFIAFQDIDGREFFRQGENFGQKELIDKNIKGRLDGKMIVNAYWDSDYNFLYKKLYTLLDITIRQGELIDFKLMEDFSSFIKLEDLKHIKFTDMRNQIQIKDNKVVIPSMFLQSNALNMYLAGTYDFDDNVDFKFKINAGQVLAEKFRRFNPKRTPKKAKNGGINLYISMLGNLYGTLDMKYRDKKEVIKALEQDMKIEFQQIQNNIKAKFDANPLEEPLDWDDDESNNNGDFGEF